jgi:hypothetical protein
MPTPTRLRCHCDPVGDNDRYLAAAVPEMEMVVCEWGAHSVAAKRAAKVTAILQWYRSFSEVRCLGITRDGAPRHPLYVKAGAVTVPFAGGV